MTLYRPDFAAGTGALSVITAFPRVNTRSPSHPDKRAGSKSSTLRTDINSDLSFTDKFWPVSSNNLTDWNCGDQLPSAFNRPAVIQDVSEAFADWQTNAVPISTRLVFKIENNFLTEKFTVIKNSICGKRSAKVKSLGTAAKQVSGLTASIPMPARSPQTKAK